MVRTVPIVASDGYKYKYAAKEKAPACAGAWNRRSPLGYGVRGFGDQVGFELAFPDAIVHLS